ncbi:MAG: SUMF1/EgtB/PvdO family nonheme iron enzyme [Thermoguttaceae bacterium]|nr:SUMF1/EgtB/PvdO family nonheme iron enzyme [Thermoguttaceae bacterium]
MTESNFTTFSSELSSFLTKMRDKLDNNITFDLPLTIGQYRLEELVGRGGMGDVYRAENLVLKRTEALKFVRSKLSASPEAIKRFREEIESTAKLLHPNIVTVFNAGEFEGRPYMVMEFLEGWTVHEFVRRRLELASPLSVQEAVDIVVQAAKGLQFAHKNGFVHRDVKPGNLWITPNKSVKVLDLGLAIATTPGSDSHIVGTPDFMSPEQCFPDSVPSTRSDIYSLGCTLFYILTGQVPFGGEEYSTPEKKMEAQREQALPPLSNYRKDVPARIQKVLNRMTAKSINDRYASMSDVIDALKTPSKKSPVFAALAGIVLLGSVALWGLNLHNNSPTTAVQSLSSNSENEKPIQDVTDPFPLGAQAGEKLVRVVDGVEYVFRWCPPGEFIMGNHGIPVSEDMSAEELFEIAQKNNLLSAEELFEIARRNDLLNDEEIEEFEQHIENLLQNPSFLSKVHLEDYKNNKVKTDLYSALCKKAQVFDTSHIYDMPHPVTLTHGFWTLDCEVTQKMWFSVMPDSTANDQIKLLGDPDNIPVRNVSWTDAQEFCQRLSKKLQANVHLPTDAQWEYACRANTEETPELVKSQTNSAETHLIKPVPAKSLSSNAWGLYNMSGNVEEWVADWYAPITDPQPKTDPTGPNKSFPLKSTPIKEAKTLRGCDYRFEVERENFYSIRIYDNKESRKPWIGFRIIVSVE